MGKPYVKLPGFMGDSLRARFLEYALANESRFEPSRIGKGMGGLDSNYRISSLLADLGELGALLEQRVMACLPSLIQELGLNPFTPSGVETEIVAHNEGAFYKRHIDILTGTDRTPEGEDRMLTLVYYLYREPKAFEGGALRLYPLVGKPAEGGEFHTDIQVEQDTAVAFSSWLPHEVMRVGCVPGQFDDSRFAVNCWVLKAHGPGA